MMAIGNSSTDSHKDLTWIVPHCEETEVGTEKITDCICKILRATNSISQINNITRVDCGRVCEDSPAHSIAYSYFYPVLLALCLFGNSFNILIYCHKNFRGTQTMKFFIIKGSANLILMVSMVSNFLLARRRSDETVRAIFWYSYTYVLCVSTIAQCMSVCSTLMLTIEMMLSVVKPIRVRSICRDAPVNLTLGTAIVVFVLVQLYFPIAVQIVSWSTIRPYKASYQISVIPEYQYYQRVYYWIQSGFIIVPFGIMVIICGCVSWHFRVKGQSQPLVGGRGFKKCIIRLAYATMLSHLAFESVQVYLTLRAALYGSDQSSEEKSGASDECAVFLVGNFLSLTNASWSFFLYVGINRRFRSMFTTSIKRMSKQRKAEVLSTPINRTTNEAMRSSSPGTERILIPLGYTDQQLTVSRPNDQESSN